MGCETEQVCAEPAKARRHEPTVIKARTPADRAREADQHQSARHKSDIDVVGTETEEQKEHRRDVVNQYEQAAHLGFGAFDRALDNAGDIIAVSEKPKTSSHWAEYLAIAVGALLAGTSGAISLWAAREIEHRIANKFIADLIKDAIAKSLKSAGATRAGGAGDIRLTFIRMCQQEIDRGRAHFIAEWPKTAARLRALPVGELRELSTKELAEGPRNELINTVELQLLTGWTNFMARLFHGGMSGWDPWQRHGREGHPTRDGYATPLRGAAKNPYEMPAGQRNDPMLDNVEPRKMQWAVDDDQRSHEGEHVGILEIHLWRDGKLNIEPSYGMRLDNVGQEVRSRFQQSGKTVRDLPVNKIVRVSNVYGQINPPITNGAFLITADGHIRLTGWALPSAELAPTAERAQDLPLAWLKV